MICLISYSRICQFNEENLDAENCLSVVFKATLAGNYEKFYLLYLVFKVMGRDCLGIHESTDKSLTYNFWLETSRAFILTSERLIRDLSNSKLRLS